VGLSILDAGVIIGVLDAGDAHHEAAVRALGAAQGRRDALALPASVFAELLVGPTRAGAAALRSVERFLDALGATVLPIDRSIARRAAALRVTGRLRLPDALVVATAIEVGADRLLTTDRGWPPGAPGHPLVEVVG